MTSRERILTALSGGKPDRVPVCLLYDYNYPRDLDVGGPFAPELYLYNDYDGSLDSAIEAHKRHPTNDMFWAMCNRTRSRQCEQTRFRLVVEAGKLLAVDRGTGKVFATRRDGDALVAVDPDSGKTTNIRPPDLPKFEKPYTTLETLADVRRHFHPLISTDEMRESRYYEFVGDEKRILGADSFVTVGGFGIVTGAVPHIAGRHELGADGAVRAYATMLEEPELFHSVCRAILDQQLQAIPVVAESGADAVLISGYWDSIDMISPKHWREFSAPYSSELVAAVHRYGLKAMFWAVGNYVPVAGDLAELGIDCIMPEPSRKGYDNSPGLYRKEVGEGVCLGGWVDELSLVNNDLAAIERTVREQIESAGQNGAFLFCGTYLTNDTDPAAVEFMCDCVRRYSL